MQSHKVEIHSQARIDFFNQVEFLAKEACSIEVVADYVEEMIAANETIGQQPYTWPLARPSKRVRRFGPTKRFRIIVFYIITADAMIRILNYSGPGRQPRWLERL